MPNKKRTAEELRHEYLTTLRRQIYVWAEQIEALRACAALVECEKLRRADMTDIAESKYTEALSHAKTVLRVCGDEQGGE